MGLSLKCRIYAERPHEPCSGTTDDGTESPCLHWCHSAPTVMGEAWKPGEHVMFPNFARTRSGKSTLAAGYLRHVHAVFADSAGTWSMDIDPDTFNPSTDPPFSVTDRPAAPSYLLPSELAALFCRTPETCWRYGAQPGQGRARDR